MVFIRGTDRTKWATYMEAMQEDKPPPDCSRRTKKSDVSKGAAYLARKTLLLTEEFFRVRYNEAIQLTQGKLDRRTYDMWRQFFREEQHAECVNLMELREVARDILLRRSTIERRACPEWLNCWVYGSEMLQRQHPGKPAYPNTKQRLYEFNAWMASLPPQDLLPVYMIQIASWCADATAWQMESRQRHGTCIIPVDDLLEDLYMQADHTILITSTSIGDAANVWCLPPSPLWWSNAVIELQVKLYQASVQMAFKGLSFRLKAPTFVPLKGERPRRPREYWPERNFTWPDEQQDPRPAWRPLPRPDYHLKDHLQYPCTAKAVASIAHCSAFLHLLRVEWTKDGWMDTLEEEQVWDEDAYYAHIDNLDFDFD